MPSEGNENPTDSAPAPDNIAAKAAKTKPTKILPTDRVGFDKQLALLRGYAAASGVDKKPVSNNEVSGVVGIHAGSVSNCNPFFSDVGLIVREAGVYKPSDAVFDYANSYEWDADGAASKLGPVIGGAWFSTVLLPRLNFRSLTKDEAIKVLAEESKATPDYRDQLSLLIDYMAAAGIISVEGNAVAKRAQSARQPAAEQPSIQPPAAQAPVFEHQPLHPFVQGLLKTLPEPETDWPIAKRIKWLQAASNIFDLIYKTEEEKTGIKIAKDAEGGPS